MTPNSTGFPIPLSLGLTSLFLTTPTVAQIIQDATLPNHSIVLPNGSIVTIEGGTQAGTNLFHSFEEFSIPKGGEAFFNNAQSIDNIITRITGSNLSDIDGLIRANGTANLFLMNPNGIVLGANARLEIGGSFLGSTAESLLFEDGSFYSATEPNTPPLLTVNVPMGLQMGSNSGAIQVNGNGHNFSVNPFAPLERNDTSSGFQVAAGHTLALVGGNVTLNGGILTAESGRIELGAVSGNTQMVGVEATDTQLTLDYTQVEQFGDIQLNEGAFADASGTGSGSIQVRARNLLLDRGSALILENSGGQPAGSIDIQTTESVELMNDDANLSVGSFIFSDALDSGSGGDISIVTPQLTMRGTNHLIRALTVGEADGGNIEIDAANVALFSSTSDTPIIDLRTLGAGNSGNLTVKTRTAILEEGSFFSGSEGSGSSGEITIEATESVELGGIVSNSFVGSLAVSAMSNSGEITINTPRLTVGNGSIISSSTVGAARAGNVTVNASEFIRVEGGGFNGAADRFEPSQIGSAGILLPEAVRLARGLPDTVSGNAGNIVLNTPRLQVSDGATVTVRHESVADAGNLQVNADEILLDGEGTLTASTTSGEGGNIQLQGLNALQLRDGALINVESFGIGNGGNIAIDSDTIALLDNSQINASAIEGTGGNIQITTLGLFVAPNSRITASSQFGVDGIVIVDNPIVDPTSGLVTLNTDPLNSNTQLQDSCDIATRSRFAITGNGGLPPDPTQPFLGQTVWRDTRLGEIDTTQLELPPHSDRTPPTDSPANPFVEATDWIVNPQGDVELVAAVPGTGDFGFARAECEDLVDNR